MKNITPYLTAGSNVVASKRNKPISKSLPRMEYGCAPLEGGHLVLTKTEYETAPEDAKRYIFQMVGSQESLKSIERYCIFISDADISTAASIPFLKERIRRTQLFRASSKGACARECASTPHRFYFITPTLKLKGYANSSIVIPIVSSSSRDFIPISLYDYKVVSNNSAFVIPNGEIWQLAILSSTMHCRWLDAVAGKIGDGYRYSNTLVWNTFPLTELTEEQKQQLNRTGQKILNARHFHPNLTLGDMYNPENMGPELLAAHQENDRVLEKIFRDKPFKDDDDRLAHLFERYAAMTNKPG